MEKIFNIVTHSVEETEALAEKLVERFVTGQVIILSGPLGAGKTAFVRGIARGLQLNLDDVNSPSYTIVNEYPGEVPLYHFDLYRLSDPTELYEVGWEDYISRNGIMVVEWGEKAEYFLPDSYVRIEIKVVSESEREIDVSLFTS